MESIGAKRAFNTRQVTQKIPLPARSRQALRAGCFGSAKFIFWPRRKERSVLQTTNDAMALTQTHTQAVVQPISLKQRGKKRAYAEVSTSPAQTSLSEARNRGIILAFIDKAFANFKRVRYPTRATRLVLKITFGRATAASTTSSCPNSSQGPANRPRSLCSSPGSKL
jgi:hypothetical protein